MANKKNTKTKRKTKAELQQEEEIKQWITIVVLCALAIVAYMKWGFIGLQLSNIMRFLFGKFYLVMIVLVVAQILITIINRHSGNTLSKNPLAIFFLIVAFLMICSYIDADHTMKGWEIFSAYTEDLRSYFTDVPVENIGGGLIGVALLSLSTLLVDWTGTILVIVVCLIVAALLLVNLKVYKQAFASIREYFSTDYEEDEEEVETEENVISISEALKLANQEKESSIPSIKADMETTQELIAQENVLPLEPSHDDTTEIPLTHHSVLPLDNIERIELQEVPEEQTVFIDIDELVDRQAALVNSHGLELEEIDDYEEEDYEIEEEYEAEEEELYEEEPISSTVTTGKLPIEDKPKATAGMYNPATYRIPNYRRVLEDIKEDDVKEDNERAAKEKGEMLIDVLRNFDVPAELHGHHIGPSVTQFEIKPDSSVKVSKIIGLADNIKMQLAAKDVRIEAPIPGRPYVGVEIPNAKSVPVHMRELFNDPALKNDDHPLTIAVGKNLQGEVVTCRLDKMPHLLIAGATGSGKSVCMNAIITSLLLRTKPDDVQLLLIDPKKVEFTPYHEIPHLIGPVVNDALQASNALKIVVNKMDERYNLFSSAGVRNIEGYNDKVKAQGGRPNADGSPAPKKLPYIVVIIDELADLMLVAGKEVESSIQRITQLARAAGIHLIVATQRPSTDVITGIIKSNIPSRIAFSVSSGIDSRTILDHVGAERLLGNGDMLYLPIGESAALRVQGVYVNDKEVTSITEAVKKQGRPLYDDAFIRLEGVEGNEATGFLGASEDPLFDEVKDYVIEVQKASTSLLQRRFGIGYNRAARMIDMLEEQGIIGPAQGSKPREVYIKGE